MFNRTLGYQQYVVPAVFLFILHQTLLIGLGLRGASEYQMRQVGPGCSGKVLAASAGANPAIYGALSGLHAVLFWSLLCLVWPEPAGGSTAAARFLVAVFPGADPAGHPLWQLPVPAGDGDADHCSLFLTLLFAVGFIWPQRDVALAHQGGHESTISYPGDPRQLASEWYGGDWSSVSGLWGQMWLQALGYGLLAWPELLFYLKDS